VAHFGLTSYDAGVQLQMLLSVHRWLTILQPLFTSTAYLHFYGRPA